MKQVQIFLLVIMGLLVVSCQLKPEGPENTNPIAVDSLYVCNFDGSDKHALPYVNSYYNLFSPDGQKIYSIFSDSIVAINTDGTGMESYEIPHFVGFIEYPRAIDETGEYLCFSEYTTGWGGLLLFNTISGLYSTIDNADFLEQSPCFQGSLLYFIQSEIPRTHAKIMSIDVTNPFSPPQTVVDSLYYPSNLCIVGSASSFFYIKDTIGIYRFDIDTEVESPVYIFGRAEPVRYNSLSCLSLAPYLYYSGEENPPTLIMNFNGTLLFQLNSAIKPSISQDGTIACYSTALYLENSDFYSCDLSTNTTHLIAEKAGVGLVSPDGTKLLYVKRTHK